jgi:hypothetical protein
MARTIGAKDKKPRKAPVRKPKSITLTLSQVQAANHLDIPVEAYAKELVKLKKKPRKKPVRKPKGSTLTFTNPKDIPDIEKVNGYVYRWVRSSIFKDSKSTATFNNNKWEIVDPNEQPTLKTFSESTMAIELGGMVLCKSKANQQDDINWERLAKNLQKALHDEFKENEELRNNLNGLEFKVKSLEHQIIGFQAVISYLESKNGHDSV